MSGKTLYDVIGVERNATTEQIRAAYLLRSKVLHPDRFDQKLQPTEWKLANEMLKELNHAYSVLRNSLDRADYDRTLSGQSQSARSTNSQQQNTQRAQSSPPPRQAPAVKLGKLESGKTYLDLLPRSIQEKLVNRVRGNAGQQISIKVSGVGGNFFIGALFAGWFWFLLSVAGDGRWDSDEFWWFLILTGGVAALQAWNLDWILNWYFSPLRYRILITPLYVIKTHWDKISFWPLWKITGMNGTHQYTNGFYRGTEVKMEFESHVENFKIYPSEAYDQLRQAILAFTNKIQSARNQQDWQYFYDQDDFREFDSERVSTTRTRHFSKRTIVTFAASFILSAIFFGIAYGMSAQSPSASASAYVPPQTSVKHPTSDSILPSDQASSQNQSKQAIQFTPDDFQPKFSEPEQSLPTQGGLEYSETFVNYTGTTAPLKVATQWSDGNYVMKVVDWNTGEFVASYFINRGSTLSIELPLGTYKLKFASGDKWYGMKYLFGPRTSYSYIPDKMTFYLSGDYAEGNSIELIPQVNGNLDTKQMSAKDW